jgi:Ca2+:H+ antiporter
MSKSGWIGLPRWTVMAPLVALSTLVPAYGRVPGPMLVMLVSTVLVGAVFAAVHHAEVVAHRVGEPYGTLILALAVTVIESALIVSIMLGGAGGAGGTAALARDTVFATVMIVCNGAVGLCLVVGALRHHEVAFRVEGAAPALSVVAALTGLTLVLPTYTVTTPGPSYSPPQLLFAGVMSFVLYAVFVFVQTVRHREYFLPVGTDTDDAHAPLPSGRTTLASLVLLVLALAAVVGLAKALSPVLQDAVTRASLPAAVVGIAIALLVLMPETFAAVRAAARNRMQTSINLALGSAIATIGLTIPAVAAISLAFHLPLELGLQPIDTVLLALTLLIGTTTFASGRATVLQGTVHLVLFAAFVFLAFVP